MSFNFLPYRGAPFTNGSVQSTTGLNFVYRGAPLLVVATPLSAYSVNYQYDSLGRLVQLAVNGLTTVYDYDAVGNRESETTT